MSILAPSTEDDAVDAIAAAIANGAPLDVEGGGTRQGLGRPAYGTHVLSTDAMTGVTMYEAAELVMTAQAGTPIREIQALLVQHGQMLAFEPMDPARLYGGERESGTIGGVIATNASGPRRVSAGAARDHVLGFRAVSGRAEVFKSGGRVMKNVTGYDLSKLMTGSHGTLAVMTEVTFKVLPKPETEQTLKVRGLAEVDALQVLRTASGSPYEVSCLAVQPDASGTATALLRVEGPEISVRARVANLEALFAGTGAHFEAVGDIASAALWAELRDGGAAALAPGPVWRVSVAPTDAHAVMGQIANGCPVHAHHFDWAGGLIWIGLSEPLPDAGAAVVRGAVDGVGGHATLMRAADAIRAEIPVFHPQPAALAALTKRTKDAFDPEHILNRGRMRADF